MLQIWWCNAKKLPIYQIAKLLKCRIANLPNCQMPYMPNTMSTLQIWWCKAEKGVRKWPSFNEIWPTIIIGLKCCWIHKQHWAGKISPRPCRIQKGDVKSLGQKFYKFTRKALISKFWIQMFDLEIWSFQFIYQIKSLFLNITLQGSM